MADCPNCGKDNAPNAIFCETCGTLMSGAYDKDVPLEPEIISKVRKIGGSGIMLVIAILQSITVLFSIPSAGGFGLRVNIPILGIFTCVAFWLIYSTCKKSEGYLISTSGMTILRVFSMIGIVLISLLIVVIGIVGVALPSLASIYENYASNYEYGVSFILYVFGIVFACVSVLLILELLKMIFAFRFVGSVKDTVNTGVPTCKSAAPLAVFLILGGIIALASNVLILIFSSQINDFMSDLVTVLNSYSSQYATYNYNYNLHFNAAFAGILGYISIFSSLFSAVLSVMIGIIVFQYRKLVKVKKA